MPPWWVILLGAWALCSVVIAYAFALQGLVTDAHWFTKKELIQILLGPLTLLGGIFWLIFAKDPTKKKLRSVK